MNRNRKTIALLALGAFALSMLGFASSNAVANVERWCPPNVPLCGGEGDWVFSPGKGRMNEEGNGGDNGGANGGTANGGINGGTANGGTANGGINGGQEG